MAESKLDEMLRLRQAPAGLTSDGAGRGRRGHELVFDRPDPARDIPETLRRMEDNGYFKKHPDALASAEVKFREAKYHRPQHVDYQKEGHPLDTTD